MEQEIKNRTKQIGVKVLQLIDELPSNNSVWVISKQIARSSISVGANYRSACRAKSNADFIHKLSIVEEEADETMYWLEILEEAGFVTSSKIAILKNEVNQIIAIIVASIKTLKAKPKI